MTFALTHPPRAGEVVVANSLDGIVGCDALITDPPYSERTHAGHDASAAGHAGAGHDGSDRRPVSYGFWSRDDAWAAVRSWHPSTRGWMVLLTDHVMARELGEALEAVGRYVFAPVPAVITGAGVRLSGDGPSSWTRWIVVARPREAPYSTWGTLPGAYVGRREEMPWIGGKPLWLMSALVRDYSRPGDLVCDPCCGAGTTMVAAKSLGRKWVGYDIDPEAVRVSRERLAAGVTMEMFP